MPTLWTKKRTNCNRGCDLSLEVFLASASMVLGSRLTTLLTRQNTTHRIMWWLLSAFAQWLAVCVQFMFLTFFCFFALRFGIHSTKYGACYKLHCLLEQVLATVLALANQLIKWCFHCSGMNSYIEAATLTATSNFLQQINILQRTIWENQQTNTMTSTTCVIRALTLSCLRPLNTQFTCRVYSRFGYWLRLVGLVQRSAAIWRRFCIHRVNWANSHNGSAMMTAL